MGGVLAKAGTPRDELTQLASTRLATDDMRRARPGERGRGMSTHVRDDAERAANERKRCAREG